MELWIIRRCRIATRRQVLAWAVILLTGLVLLGYNWRYVENFFLGPFHVSASDLAQITDVNNA